MMKKDTVVIDIDGCLNHYPGPLKMWAEVLFNIDKSESVEAIKKRNDFDLLKKTYRHSTIFSYLLPRAGSREILNQIKKRGYIITLLTARNPDKNPHIKDVTTKWLYKYKIPFNSIIFSKDKGAYVKKNEHRIIMVVEDEAELLSSFDKLKTEVVVFNNDFNGHLYCSHFHEVFSWKEVSNLFENFVGKSN